MICTMCSSQEVLPFYEDQKRSWQYWHCSNCDLVFRDPQSYLSLMQEKGRYQTHNNTIEAPGYVRFLTPAVEAVRRWVPEEAKGLDYGCGPGPTLSELIRRANYQCVDFDPIFFNSDRLLAESYDFITCTEVVEHFYSPIREFKKIEKLIKKDGHLVVMTDHRRLERDFGSWGYRTDPTHVCFYSESTWRWLARAKGWDFLEMGDRTAIFRL